MEMSSELAKPIRALDDTALSEIGSLDDARKALQAAGIEIESASDYGTGFVMVEKDSLLGVPFLALQWKFAEGDFGSFVVVHAITAKNEKVVFTDGSTGIKDQFYGISEKRLSRGASNPYAGLAVEQGLRKSDYEVEVNGKPSKATTYYLSM